MNLRRLYSRLTIFSWNRYIELSKYNCRKAIELFEDTIPPNHRSSGWVLGLLGKAHFELAEYKEAKT